MIPSPRLMVLLLLSPLVMALSTTARAESAVEAETDVGAPSGGEALSSVELDELCGQLAAEAVADRQNASDRIKSAAVSSLAIISDRLDRDLLSAPGDIEGLMKKVADRRQPQQLPPRSEDPPLDVIPTLLELEPGREEERAVREVTEVVVLLRALSQSGDSAATLAMIRYSPRERGGFLAEIARNSKRMGDRAIPGLLRAVRHPDTAVSENASKLLSWIMRSDFSQQVQVRDPTVLAEILTIYGETGDRDAMPVLLSFSGSEKAVVRQAARESAMRFGRAILWPAKAKYESFTGDEPNRGWDWREVLDRLFEAQDRARMAQAERSMSDGLAQADRGRYQEMLELYEQILCRWPSYERRAEMVPGMVAYAEIKAREDDHAGARQLIHQALLLAPNGDSAPALRAKLLLWEIEADLARGIADPTKLERLADLGYSSPQTEWISEQIRDRIGAVPPRFYRLVAASGLAVFGLACLGLLILRALPKGWLATKVQKARADEATPPPAEPEEGGRAISDSAEHEPSTSTADETAEHEPSTSTADETAEHEPPTNRTM